MVTDQNKLFGHASKAKKCVVVPIAALLKQMLSLTALLKVVTMGHQLVKLYSCQYALLAFKSLLFTISININI